MQTKCVPCEVQDEILKCDLGVFLVSKGQLPVTDLDTAATE
jgi:hypothetical protein